MKKLFLLLFLAFTFTMSANAQVSDVIDTVKAEIESGVGYVDTSSTFKQVYSDVKQGLVGLAAGLKVGVEHVYKVLVKQQVVLAISWLLYLISLIPIGFILYKGGVKIYAYCDDDNPMGLFHMDIIVTGFVNPEYGAIKEIINLISR